MVYNRHLEMKKILFVMAFLLGALHGWSNPNYTFSDTTSDGQVLYYNIVNGSAELVAPWTEAVGGLVYVGWDVYTKPVGALVIPDSVTYAGTTFAVTSIGIYAFANCRQLMSVTIPATITSIGQGAFEMCDAIIEMNVPATVTYIGNNAFNWVYLVNYNGTASGRPWGALCVNGYREGSLYYTNPTKDTLVAAYCYITDTVLTIPSTVTAIGNNAFNSMINLTEVIIPASVVSIGSGAFYGCTGLTQITSYATVAPFVQSNTFTNVTGSIPVNIPCGSMMSYYSRWNYFSNFVEEQGFGFSAMSADESMGTVQILTQPTCSAPSTVVNAVANEGYRFDHWNNGSTANPYVFALTMDTVIVAHFARSISDTVYVHDTVWIHDTLYVHDTIYITEQGIGDVNTTNVMVYQRDGQIVVEGDFDGQVALYDVNGRVLAVKRNDMGTIRFDVTASGAYLIKVGNHPARKIVVVR